MREKLPKILLVLVLGLILVNLGYFDYKLFFDESAKTEIETPLRPVESDSAGASEGQAEKGDCNTNCQELIDAKINEAVAKIPTQALTKSSSVVPASPGNSQSIIYIPVCSDGSSVSRDWANIASCEFYFDLNDYSKAKEVRFIASLRMVNSSARASVRLYDLTNFRGVDYSDLSSSGSDFKRAESSGIVIWRGNNKYIVQLKSGDGNEIQLKEAKLKISF